VIALPVEFELQNISGDGAIYSIIHTHLEGKVRLFFDENMCIDLNQCDGAITKFRNVLHSFEYATLDNTTLRLLEVSLFNVLKWCESTGYLFTGSMYESLKDYTGMLLISNKDYSLAKALLSEKG
jgi:hypothetical protein